jgi:hypothetical protein
MVRLPQDSNANAVLGLVFRPLMSSRCLRDVLGDVLAMFCDGLVIAWRWPGPSAGDVLTLILNQNASHELWSITGSGPARRHRWLRDR